MKNKTIGGLIFLNMGLNFTTMLLITAKDSLIVGTIYLILGIVCIFCAVPLMVDIGDEN